MRLRNPLTYLPCRGFFGTAQELAFFFGPKGSVGIFFDFSGVEGLEQDVTIRVDDRSRVYRVIVHCRYFRPEWR